MIFSFFDMMILGALILLNLVLWRRPLDPAARWGCLIFGLAFGVLFPVVSQIIEVRRVAATAIVYDNFTLLFTFLKFPMYWFIGAMQSSLNAYFYKKHSKPNHPS